MANLPGGSSEPEIIAASVSRIMCFVFSTTASGSARAARAAHEGAERRHDVADLRRIGDISAEGGAERGRREQSACRLQQAAPGDEWLCHGRTPVRCSYTLTGTTWPARLKQSTSSGKCSSSTRARRYHCIDVDVSKPTARGGQTLVRIKMRNLLTRAVFDKTFKAGDKFTEPDLSVETASYLYSDGVRLQLHEPGDVRNDHAQL